jgi:hypothetical protein
MMLSGDQSAPNVNQSNFVRAGGLEDCVSFFRYDQWWPLNPTAPKNSHSAIIRFDVVANRPLMRDIQTQIAEFFASNGATFVAPPGLTAYWEVPIVALPWGLNYIP